MYDILKKLAGGDLRSIGSANEVVDDVINNPELFGAVFHGMQNDDAVIRMRSADVIEKVTIEHPEYLQPYKKDMIKLAAAAKQQEVRWHMAQILPRLDTNKQERTAIGSILLNYLNDKSRITQTFSIQALADIAKQDDDLRHPVITILENMVETGSPAVKTRCRKLLQEGRAQHKHV